MATKELLKRLEAGPSKSKEDDAKFFYEWCAKYCVFRDEGSVKNATDMPVISYRKRAGVVRNVYRDEDGFKLDFASKLGKREVVAFDDKKVTDATAKQKLDVKDLTATKADALIVVDAANPGALVLVDEPVVEGVEVGAGGVAGAPHPSYSIVGTLTKVEPTRNTVMVYARGGHFVLKPYPVSIPVNGMDKIYNVQVGADRQKIADALTGAYQNLGGLGDLSINATTKVAVDENGAFKLGGKKAGDNLADFHRDKVAEKFNTEEGTAYAAALAQKAVYTYVSDFSVLDEQLELVVATLRGANVAGAVKLRDVATQMLALFPGEGGTPPVTTQPGEAEALRRQLGEGAQQIEELQAQLAEARRNVGAETLRRQLREGAQQIEELQAQLAEARRNVGAETSRTIASLEDKVDVLEKTNLELNRKMDLLGITMRGQDEDLTASRASERELRDQIRRLQAKVLDVGGDPGKAIREPKNLKTDEVRTVRVQIDQLAMAIVALRTHLRRNPNDVASERQLRKKEAQRDALSGKLFDLTR